MADKITDNEPLVQGNSDAPNPVRPSWETVAVPRVPAQRPAPSAPLAPSGSTWPTPPQSSLSPTASPALPLAVPLESLGNPNVRYDLAGNPISEPALGPSPAPYAPPTPFGYSSGNPTSTPLASAPGVWPPPISGPIGLRNNSGEQSHLPPEIERLRWNWGAFFFPTMWCRKHGLTTAARALRYGFLVIVILRMVFQTVNPLVFLLLGILYGGAYWTMRIYFGLKGHSIGWRNRHFPGGLEEYHKVQNAWMWWGVGINAVSIILLPLLIVLLAAQFGLSHLHPNVGPRFGNSYGSGQ